MAPWSLTSLLVLALACRGDPSGPPPSPVHWPSVGGPPGTGRWEGVEADAGFGSALAIGGDRVFVGAPHGVQGQVYALSAGGLSPALSGPGRLGATLAVADGLLLVGAPLDHLVMDGRGGTRLSSPSAGIALVGAADGRWAAADADGLWLDGAPGPALPARASSLAFAADRLAAGMPLGPDALWIDGLAIPRGAAGDEAGFALAAGDVDGDGDIEWLVGAPGAGRVDILAPDGSLEASLHGDAGRFGAALAVADVDGDGTDDLLVGAPMANQRRGRVELFRNGDLADATDSWEGQEEGDQLGFAVAAATGRLVLGAPGAAGQPGAAWVLTPP